MTRVLPAVLALLLALAPADPVWAGANRDARESPAALALFRDGVLPDGSPLRAQREGEPDALGRDAACVNCHGRSGMGVVEGRIVIPPITGPALFRPGEPGDTPPTDHHRLPTSRARPAYDDATLARALREGIDPSGRALDFLMPRFALDDDAMRVLLPYLRSLSSGRTPGLVNDELHFATVITPDADPAKRAAMLAVLRAYFDMKSDESDHPRPGSAAAIALAHGGRPLPRWRLHVWQLEGAPDTWDAQLEKHLRTEPVFALVSGLAGRTWAPVHAFCERVRLPCLFPNVDSPVVAEDDFYPVYFSRGVLLEADTVATYLRSRLAAGHGRVVQVYRADDVGADAGQALQRQLKADGIASLSQVVGSGAAPADAVARLARAIGAARAGDTLVLWLRGSDLAALPAQPPPGVDVVLSGRMGGLEAAPLPKAWRERARMTYPYALNEERRVLNNYALGWMRMARIPLTEATVQVDTYIACSILAENLVSSHQTYLRDFLLERTEAMIGSDLFAGNYRRLGLAHGQRFASKGAYVVRWSDGPGPMLVPDGAWIVP